MLGSPILGVAIGMAFIYLLLSLIVSAIQELLSSLVETRSANLYNGIRSLLSGDTTLLRLLYNHGLIAGLYKNPAEDFAGLGRSWCTGIRIALQPVIGIRRIAGPNDAEITSDPLLLPAYIPARTFAIALIDLLNESKASGVDIMPAIRTTLAATTASAGKVYVGIEALALRAGDDADQFQTSLEDWYSDAMDRVSGWYKKHVQNILLVVGILLSLIFNVDSIRIARSLWIQPAVAQSFAAAAGDYARNAPPPGAIPPSGNPAADITSAVANFTQITGNFDLPVGWRRTLPEYWVMARTPSWSLLRTLFQSAIGWLITAFALSFGAPFWFDTLNRFMVVRATVKPQEKSQNEPPKN